MANLAAPALDFSGASGEPTSQAALVTIAQIAPPAVIVYTDGILVVTSIFNEGGGGGNDAVSYAG